MAIRVAGDLYVDIDGQLMEIKRQLRQKEGYPYDPMQLVEHLQMAIEGNLVDRKGKLFRGSLSLLRRITTITTPAVQHFVAKDCLKEVNVGWTGANFKKLFLDKIEENVPEAKLVVSRLERASLDAPILTELGSKAEVSLADLFDLLKKQSKGEDGALLTNGYANIFYVRGTDGNLWAVDASWRSGGRFWGVGAFSVGLPSRWHGGSQLFSRDS